jgi:hypothetical protein
MRIVQLTVGHGYDKDNNPIDNGELLLAGVRQTLAKTFGGFTETQGLGGWINPEGVQVVEAVKVYTIATDKSEGEVEVCAAACRDLLHQHSVFLADGNTPKFV